MGLELLHLSYVKRWVVAPTHREQSVAEHTFRVMVITRELCKQLGIPTTQTWEIMSVAFGHDGDEVMTGDIPGPIKSKEMGYLQDINKMDVSECIVKVADSIETGTFWLQWGNPGVWSGHPYNSAPARDIEKIKHYAAKIPRLLEAAQKVWFEITRQEMFQWPT